MNRTATHSIGTVGVFAVLILGMIIGSMMLGSAGASTDAPADGAVTCDTISSIPSADWTSEELDQVTVVDPDDVVVLQGTDSDGPFIDEAYAVEADDGEPMAEGAQQPVATSCVSVGVGGQ